MTQTHLRKLGEIVEFAYGRALPKEQRLEGTVPVYGSNGITGWHSEALVEVPTIIVGRKGSAGAVQLTDGPSYPIDTTYYVKPHRSGSIDTKYLFYILERANLNRLATATGVPGLNREDAYRVDVPVPCLDEQRRIVDILDRAADIRRLRRLGRETARQIIPALFTKVFRDGGAKDKVWRALPIGDMLADVDSAIRTGPFGSQLRHSEFVSEGVPVLGIDNVVTNRFVWNSARCIPPEKFEGFRRFTVYPRDLLITIMGTTGRCAVAPDDLPLCMSTKHLCVLTLNQAVISPWFTWAALLFDPFVRSQIARTGHGAIMEGWNMGLVRRLKIRVPPLDLQAMFARQVADVMRLTRRQCAAEAACDAVAQAIQSRLFSA